MLRGRGAVPSQEAIGEKDQSGHEQDRHNIIEGMLVVAHMPAMTALSALPAVPGQKRQGNKEDVPQQKGPALLVVRAVFSFTAFTFGARGTSAGAVVLTEFKLVLGDLLQKLGGLVRPFCWNLQANSSQGV